MNKQEILSFIEQQISEGKITKDDLVNLKVAENLKHENSKNIINILYIVGAVIALVGVIVLVFQNWDSLNYFGRVFITLGMSLVAYIVGFLIKDSEHNVLSQTMFTFSAVLAPVGTGVLLHEANIQTTPVLVSMLSLMWAIVFGLALWTTRKNILTLITIFFATVSLYSITAEVLMGVYNSSLYYKWLTILIGIAYVLIGYVISDSDKERKSVRGVLYGLGTLGILGSFITFGGVFDLLMIALVFGSFYASVFLRSRIMLSLSAIFLIAHIIKITAKYFSNSMNWSVALIFSGIIIIATGYLTFYLNKRFISKK